MILKQLKVDEDLLSINTLSATLILAVVFIPESPLRTVLGLPFVLFFPGYTLISALFPSRKDLDEIERLALSIGLSLAVVPLMGLALNYTPLGIRLYPILSSLFLFTFLMSMVAEYRRRLLPTADRFNPSVSANLSKWVELGMSNKLMSAGLIMGVVTAGGFIAYFASMPRVGERFTEFYILGPAGKIEDYPTNLTLGESGTVILGIVNHEYENVTYTVVVKLDNETIGAINSIVLGHEGKLEENYTFMPEKVGDRMKLEFLLFREGVDESYRSLHLWITVRPQE